MTASGFCDAGRTTTVLPIASAGPSLPAMFTIGKLYGVMHATTPTGCAPHDRAHEPTGRERGRRHLLRRQRDHVVRLHRVRARSDSKRVHAVGTCICLPTVAVQPVSAITSGNRSSKRALIASRGSLQEVGAHLGLRARPRVERFARGAGGVLGLRDRRFRRLVDDLFGGRVHDVVGTVGPVGPLPADEQLSRRHGRKCNAFYFRRVEPTAPGISRRTP